MTGSGRSGTKYIAFVCRRLGLDVRHEELGRDGIASWTMAVRTEQSPFGPPSSSCTFDHVFHQVRQPLAAIQSATTFDPASWEFIAAFTGCARDEPVLLRAARYWLTWNEQAEQIADWRNRVEDLRDSFAEFCERLGVACDETVLDRVPVDINTRLYGRRLHIAEELFERLGLDMPRGLRARMRTSGTDGATPVLRYDDLESLDPALCARIRDKALAYGYAA